MSQHKKIQGSKLQAVHTYGKMQQDRRFLCVLTINEQVFRQIYPMEYLYHTPQAAVVTVLLAVSMVAVSFALARADILPASVAERDSPLDGLRGILASAVMAHHFYIFYQAHLTGKWQRPETELLNNLGGVSVSVFFLITGFLFLSKIRQGEPDWGRLYLLRVKRIVPLYLFVFAAVSLLTLSAYPFAPKTVGLLEWLRHWLLFRGGEVSNLIASGVTWTLQYEWAFYFALPVLYVLWRFRLPKLWFVPATAVAVWYVWRHSQHHLYLLFPLSLPAVLMKRQVQALMRRFPQAVHLLMAVLPLYLLMYTTAYSYTQMVLLAVPFAFLANGYSYGGLLKRQGLRKLGEISFSIYLVHGLVLDVLHHPLRDFALRFGMMPFLMLLPLVYGMSVACSLLTYRFIERPFLYRQTGKAA